MVARSVQHQVDPLVVHVLGEAPRRHRLHAGLQQQIGIGPCQVNALALAGLEGDIGGAVPSIFLKFVLVLVVQRHIVVDFQTLLKVIVVIPQVVVQNGLYVGLKLCLPGQKIFHRHLVCHTAHAVREAPLHRRHPGAGGREEVVQRPLVGGPAVGVLALAGKGVLPGAQRVHQAVQRRPV